MHEKPIIEAQNISKEYYLGGETIHAVHNVSLKIKRGEFVAIMGTSGSGKSTFMNLVGALDVPSSGSLLVGGKNIAKMSSDNLANLRSKLIGFVFQQFNLMSRSNAFTNVKLPLSYSGIIGGEALRRAEESLKLVGLSDRADHLPSQLSGGQQQRVAIARALVNNPQIILADEPTGALDTQTSGEIMKLFQHLNSQGITIILVTHEQEISDYASRKITFRDGGVISDTGSYATSTRMEGIT
ncbi:MAG: ABC transporter ATP-binding protein [Sphingomonadales bacterium]